jgi:hypothetical protein
MMQRGLPTASMARPEQHPTFDREDQCRAELLIERSCWQEQQCYALRQIQFYAGWRWPLV